MERHEKIARNLARLIEERGRNPSSLAKSVGLNHTAARDIISGKSRNPTDRTLFLLAKGLGVHITELSDEAPGEVLHEEIGVVLGGVEKLTHGNQTRDTIHYLAPTVRDPQLYIVLREAPGFTYKTGSFLIIDPHAPPSRLGDYVVISKFVNRNPIPHSALGRFYPPYIVPSDPAVFGVAFTNGDDETPVTEGTIVASFMLDAGTTAAVLNGSHDLD